MSHRLAYLTAGFAIALAAILAGCGYTSRSLVTQQYRSIAVRQFTNAIDITREADAENKYKIYRPLIEVELTQAVINRFLADGQLKVLGPKEAALVLEGQVVEFRKDPLQYDEHDTVLEYRITITADVKLWDRPANRLLWEEKRFSGTTTYFTQGAHAQSEDSAIETAVLDTSRRILERVVEQW